MFGFLENAAFDLESFNPLGLGNSVYYFETSFVKMGPNCMGCEITSKATRSASGASCGSGSARGWGSSSGCRAPSASRCTSCTRRCCTKISPSGRPPGRGSPSAAIDHKHHELMRNSHPDSWTSLRNAAASATLRGK